MKLSITLFSMLVGLITLSSYQNTENKNVNLTDLKGKNFKSVIQFTKKTTPKQVDNAVEFLRQYNSSINIIRSIDDENGNVALEIRSKTVVCKTNNLGYGIILLDQNNKCQCAISEKIE